MIYYYLTSRVNSTLNLSLCLFFSVEDFSSLPGGDVVTSDRCFARGDKDVVTCDLIASLYKEPKEVKETFPFLLSCIFSLTDSFSIG